MGVSSAVALQKWVKPILTLWNYSFRLNEQIYIVIFCSTKAVRLLDPIEITQNREFSGFLEGPAPITKFCGS